MAKRDTEFDDMQSEYIKNGLVLLKAKCKCFDVRYRVEGETETHLYCILETEQVGPWLAGFRAAGKIGHSTRTA